MITIYYIEDDENISHSVREFLSRHGYSVSVFPTIASAKQAFYKRVPALALIVETLSASGSARTGRNCRLFSSRSGMTPAILFQAFRPGRMIMW